MLLSVCVLLMVTFQLNQANGLKAYGQFTSNVSKQAITGSGKLQFNGIEYSSNMKLNDTNIQFTNTGVYQVSIIGRVWGYYDSSDVWFKLQMLRADDNGIAGESVVFFLNNNNGAQDGPMQFMVEIKDIDVNYFVKVVCNENGNAVAFGAAGGADLNRPYLIMDILYIGD